MSPGHHHTDEDSDSYPFRDAVPIPSPLPEGVTVEQMSTRYKKGLMVAVPWAVIMTCVAYIAFTLYISNHDLVKDGLARDQKILENKTTTDARIDNIYRAMAEKNDEFNRRMERLEDKVDSIPRH